ncbi:hypothetical protein Prum_040480 [Phytohabitans rumicis]|uniref:Uncharacterized protein n=1 Tax=Phytohabitans rumicis TaxID=1076125 RepID=A0A6V8L8G7_9ACTN|nr:hypothetical protein Prum_040480 [Phytohabitans rumicis]
MGRARTRMYPTQPATGSRSTHRAGDVIDGRADLRRDRGEQLPLGGQLLDTVTKVKGDDRITSALDMDLIPLTTRP